MKKLALLLSALFLCSCSDKFLISFHMETDSMDSKKFAFTHKGRFYTKSAFITNTNIESFYSFQAEDNTYGVVFILKPGLSNRLEGMTAQNLGKRIQPIVNGHFMNTLRLYSKPITTGKIPIHGGFSAADIKELADHVNPPQQKTNQKVFKLAPATKRLLHDIDPDEVKKQKDPEENENRTVISERRGRF